MKGFLLFFIITALSTAMVRSQTAREISRGAFDSSQKSIKKSDTATQLKQSSGENLQPVHSPKKATFRSGVLPGWGQAYNREYWKIPIVYGALGVTAGFFIYNNTWYKRSRAAFNIRTNNDTSQFPSIHPNLQVVSTESIRTYRNFFRRDRDYAVLYFILAWGLNVVDATVFAHLKEFDVSDDLAFSIKPILNAGSKLPGVGLALTFKSPRQRQLLEVR